MKQKLSERNTYTPPGTSLARCNCDPVLNKEETLSVQDLKTYDNSPEVNQAQQTERSLKPFVFALNCGDSSLTTRVGVFSHDFYKVLKLIRKAEFKRRQAAIGIKMHKKSFGYGRRIPIVQKWNLSL